ncbi:MAG: thiosulfate oxidation carrier complex protein SoxZ [Betaproteobacteria bacterium]|nr:thiosulfate oxidation carrier complex protein SoxZ [Betaproteobacteria bacterium]
MTPGQAIISLPSAARPGETVEVRVLIAHPMETGLRSDDAGQTVPRHIIREVVVEYAGTEVLRAELSPAITANPYLSVFLRAGPSGPVVCRWIDDRGREGRAQALLRVA